MKWNNFNKRQKFYFFIITFIIGFIIRMADATSIIMCLYYIILSLKIYKVDERKNTLGLIKTTWRNYIISSLVPGLFIVIFLPFYILSPLCPMHLFDELLITTYSFLGNVWLVVIIFYIMIGTFSVFAEEIYFRGFLQDAMDDLLGLQKSQNLKKLTTKKFWSLFCVSFLFGICHLNLLWASIFEWMSVPIDFSFIIVGIISLSSIGFVFGFLRIKFNSLYPAIICHAIGNFFMILLPTIIILINGGFS